MKYVLLKTPSLNINHTVRNIKHTVNKNITLKEYSTVRPLISGKDWKKIADIAYKKQTHDMKDTYINLYHNIPVMRAIVSFFLLMFLPVYPAT